MSRSRKTGLGRWLRRLAAGVWVAVTLLVLALWIRSLWIYDRVHFLSERFAVDESRTMLIVFRTGSGRFIYNYDASWGKHIPAYQAVLSKTGAGLGSKRAWGRVSVWVDDSDMIFQLTFLQGLGFVWDGESTGSSAVGRERRIYAIGAPYWALILPLAFPAVVLFILDVRRKRILWHRQQRGQCLECGYDLRATPQRCPECGWEQEAPQSIRETAP